MQYTYDQIKRLRAKATRRALDWQHQTTTYLARTYGTVVVEQLNILSMTKAPKPKPDPDNEGNYLRNGPRPRPVRTAPSHKRRGGGRSERPVGPSNPSRRSSRRD
ncbi:hypothetical protein [Streptomyces sp. NPDC092129]|uniref:hypothetical protein n=1 Tax=Streptomyces sp. NPDC092129 TaxID=3366010 RepID=UPI0037F1E127